MIEKLLYPSRITEVDSTALHCINAYKQSNLDTDANLNIIMTLLGTKSTSLTEAVKRIKTKSQLEEEDNKRDDKHLSFYYLVKGNTHHPSNEIGTAAKAIMKVLDHYSLNMIREGYSTESSLLNSAIKDLSQPDIQAHMALLSGASEAFTALQEAQQRFATLFLAYETDKATESSYANASTIKKEVV